MQVRALVGTFFEWFLSHLVLVLFLSVCPEEMLALSDLKNG